MAKGRLASMVADRYVEHPWSFNDPEVPEKHIQTYSHLRICLDIFMIFMCYLRMTITYNTYGEMLLSTSPATSVERDPYGSLWDFIG